MEIKTIKKINKDDIEKEYINALKLEEDYELASLFIAMDKGEEYEKERCKKRLIEIQDELLKIEMYF